MVLKVVLEESPSFLVTLLKTSGDGTCAHEHKADKIIMTKAGSNFCSIDVWNEGQM